MVASGRGLAGAATLAAITAAKLAALTRRAAKPPAQPRQRPVPHVRMTAEEIDRELERRDTREREKPPD